MRRTNLRLCTVVLAHGLMGAAIALGAQTAPTPHGGRLSIAAVPAESTTGAAKTAAVLNAVVDIDGNGTTDALTDGLLMLRYLFGLRGQPLIQGAIGAGASRTTTQQIEDYLAPLTTGPAGAGADIDGNGTFDALTDGLLVVRYLFGLRGPPLIQGAIGAGASRTTTQQIQDYLGTLVLAVQPPGNFCTGPDQIVDVAWPASGQVRSATNGFATQTMAYRITVPSVFNPPLNVNHLGFGHFGEVSGTAVTARDMTVSRNACDFQSGTYLFNEIGAGDTAPQFNFTVNNPLGFVAAGGNFNLQSGDVVYVNVRNAVNGVPSCPDASCDVLFDFATPNRY